MNKQIGMISIEQKKKKKRRGVSNTVRLHLNFNMFCWSLFRQSSQHCQC